MYEVDISKSAIKSLSKLDKQTRTLITNWIEKNLDGCENPRLIGKPLVGDKAGYWRYRLGDYRVIAEINDDKLIILVVRAAHRKNAYN